VRSSLWSGLIVAGIAVGFLSIGVWQVLEQRTYNLLHQVKRELVGSPDWSDQIAVIAIDDASVKELGRFPWPRSYYADLLDQLAPTQPAVVVFDILFSEPTDQDAQFAQSIVNSANVVLAVGIDSLGNRLSVTPSIADPADGFFLVGEFTNNPDEDGISRRLRLLSEDTTTLPLTSAALQIYKETLAATASAASVSPSTSIEPLAPETFEHLQPMLNDSLPADQPIWINWPGEVDLSRKTANEIGNLQIYSFVDVINDRIDPSQLQNKFVLVGASLPGVDSLRTPFHINPPVGGVYLYAATIDNLLRERYLQRPSQWQQILLLSCLALVGSRWLWQQSLRQRLALVIGFPLIWSGVALSCFWAGWWIPVAAPVGTIMFSALAIQLHEQRERQQLMALFSMNVSPETAEMIWQRKSEILSQGDLAAQDLTATVLFMDIRGFTTIAETLPSQQLLPWLNQYFETMTDCIMAHGGMVDKYIGDAIMAVFGAPVPRMRPAEVKADAIAAVEAAIKMQQRLGVLNRRLVQQGLPAIKFGIGIHTGPLVAGTVGNRYRLNYSLFGDTVNVAARIEKLTKTLPETAPIQLLLSSTTADCIHTHFPLKRVSSSTLRGRQETSDLYTLSSDALP